MILTKTPFRISFFGGGTDYDQWYRSHGGAFLSTTIKRYSYISVRQLPPFFEKKHRIVWSLIELVDKPEEIEHPVIRSVFQELNVVYGTEVHHQGDLPSRSGLGSSSSFAVGLIKALTELQGECLSKKELADKAIYVERVLLGETVGIQDQVAAAFGGLNRVVISNNGSYEVTPVLLPQTSISGLQNHLILFYTGVSRFASDIAAQQVENFGIKQANLHRMRELVDLGYDALVEGRIGDIGHLLDEAWQLKRGLANEVSPSFIDEIYDRAMAAGATGGKLLGAGGGGFMLLFVNPNDREALMRSLSDLIAVPVEFESQGSVTLYSVPDGFSQTSIRGNNFAKIY